MKTLFMNNKNNPERLAWLAQHFPNHKPEDIKKLTQTCPVCKKKIFTTIDSKFHFCSECLIHFKNQEEILRVWLASERNKHELQTISKN